MPKDDLEIFEKTLLFSREQASFFGNLDRQSRNCRTATQRTDENLSEKITKFATTIAGKNTYQILLRFLVDLGLVNQSIK